MSTWISSMWRQEAGPKDIWLPLGVAQSQVCGGQRPYRASPSGWQRDICAPRKGAPCCRGVRVPPDPSLSRAVPPGLRETGQICAPPQGQTDLQRAPPAGGRLAWWGMADPPGASYLISLQSPHRQIIDNNGAGLVWVIRRVT